MRIPAAWSPATLWDVARDWNYATYRQFHGSLSKRRPFRVATAGRPASARPPVLLLPGIYERWHFLGPLVKYLEGRGHEVHVLEALGFNLHPVPASAGLVASYLAERDLSDVVVIAHSKGGLIGKYLMASAEAGHRIRKMIAVNTPFGGSVYARYAPTPTLRAFSPKDPTLQELAGNLDINQRVTSIFSRIDPQIPGGSRLEGARNIQLDVVGHFRILADPEFVKVLTSELDAERPQDSGPPGI